MNPDERKIALEEKWFEFRKEMYQQKMLEEKKEPVKEKKTINPVYAAIMVAIIGFIGTTVATIINNNNQNKLEQQKFESDLIKKSLEEETQEDKILSLKLLTTLHLIKDSEVKNALDSFLRDTSAAMRSLPVGASGPGTTTGAPIENVGRSFKPEAFNAYVNGLQFDSWKPQYIVLHNEGTPLKQWNSMPGYLRMQRLAEFFGKERQWKSGPHLFITGDSIWVLSPLTRSGIHSPSWNKNSIGVEMVGDYTKEALDDGVRDNTIKAIASLCRVYGISPDSLKFHSEDPKSPGKLCPGKNVSKSDMISRVKTVLGL
jgi:hypothetical protein